MKKNKFIFGFVIAIMLVISYFISGNHNIVALHSEDINSGIEISQSTLSSDNKTELKEPGNIPESTKETDKAEKENTNRNTGLEELKSKTDKTDKVQPVEKKSEATIVKENKPKEMKQEKSSEVPNNKNKTQEQKASKEKIIKKDNDNKDKKDKYLTDPVPEGKPKPVEWQGVTINKQKPLTATLSVTCKTILNNMDMFNKNKLEVLPNDGIIYQTQTVTFYEGESVFDVLLREMQKNKIHMEFVMTPIYNSNYVEGINNLYEFDCGELSGWMYKVNGWFPNYGASRYYLKDGDVIEWIYTCDLGRDIGGDLGATGGQ